MTRHAQFVGSALITDVFDDFVGAASEVGHQGEAAAVTLLDIQRVWLPPRCDIVEVLAKVLAGAAGTQLEAAVAVAVASKGERGLDRVAGTAGTAVARAAADAPRARRVHGVGAAAVCRLGVHTPSYL